MIIKEKEIKTSRTYRAHSALQEPRSALRGLMQRLGLTLLGCTLVISVAEAQQAVNGATQGAPPISGLLEKSSHLQAAHSTFRHLQV
jgi:hypothetical protein